MNPSKTNQYPDDTINIIKRLQSFYITTHVRADGDALGSEIALFYALKQLNKSVYITNESTVPNIYKFFIPPSGMYIHPNLPSEKPEVVICLDCPTLDRTGKITDIIPKDAAIINIDHHISNELFGNINWVIEDMSSTGEMILSLMKKMDITITPDIATAIYVAIVTDTGRFTHSNTTPEVFRAAAFLLEHGAKHEEITKNVYNTNPFNLLQLYAQTLNTIELHLDNKVATVFLTKEMMEKAKVDPIDTHEFADIPVSIDGVSIGILFRDMASSDFVKASLRSRNGFNVNSIAKKFGGGGHKYASGCEIQGSIKEAQRLIIDEIKKTLQENSC
ncbi:MAG: bifunctional oligoribonuclease/PAP phosphatase NrnA [Candidatus Kuenenia sp.]|nr:bifunctional oligoribonuclease/PAP phosphatase NrnA [Candidatus Kuenenia hertensis]